MLIRLTRDIYAPTFTLGSISVDGVHLGYSCEDVDRALSQSMSAAEIGAVKVMGRRPIATGRYGLVGDWSPKYKRDMMRLEDVPGFKGIRIHSGNTHEDTEGCILPGLRRDANRGMVLQSRDAIRRLDPMVVAALSSGEVWIEVVGTR